MVAPSKNPFPPDCAQRYAWKAQLAAGGFGTVHLAHQRSLDRPVAIKLLNAGALQQPEHVARFLEEARIAASFFHPHIVGLLDHGAAPVPWIAYEYLPGRNLRQLLMAGEINTTLAIQATIQVARALGAAHERGILHRDIKPENILEAEPGLFKVTDFGMAKWEESSRIQTALGVVLGTPAYISPEQILGEPVTPAADVYALGTLLFELLTGRVPYDEENVSVQLDRHLHSPIPSLAVGHPDLPGDLDGILKRALAKSPQERFPNARELADVLQPVLSVAAPARTQVVSRASRPSSKNITVERRISPPAPGVSRGRMAAAAVLLFSLGWGAGARWRPDPPPRRPSPAAVTTASASPANAFADWASHVDLNRWIGKLVVHMDDFWRTSAPNSNTRCAAAVDLRPVLVHLARFKMDDAIYRSNDFQLLLLDEIQCRMRVLAERVMTIAPEMTVGKATGADICTAYSQVVADLTGLGDAVYRPDNAGVSPMVFYVPEEAETLRGASTRWSTWAAPMTRRQLELGPFTQRSLLWRRFHRDTWLNTYLQAAFMLEPSDLPRRIQFLLHARAMARRGTVSPVAPDRLTGHQIDACLTAALLKAYGRAQDYEAARAEIEALVKRVHEPACGNEVFHNPYVVERLRDCFEALHKLKPPRGDPLPRPEDVLRKP